MASCQNAMLSADTFSELDSPDAVRDIAAIVVAVEALELSQCVCVCVRTRACMRMCHGVCADCDSEDVC